MIGDLADFDDVSDVILIPPKKGIKNHALDSLSMIVLDDDVGHPSTRQTCDIKYDKIFLDNKNLVKFIEKCFALENSDGMARIVNRTLLGLYQNTCPEYKSSHRFQNILDNAFMKLELDPKHKFSHIKGVCDALKLHKVKKKAKLITMSTALQDKLKEDTALQRRSPVDGVSKKKSRFNFINLDDNGANIIEIKDDDSDVIVVDNSSKLSNEHKITIRETIKTENSTNEPMKEMDVETKIIKDVQDINVDFFIMKDSESKKTELLVPVGKKSSTIDTETRIKEIEITIANYKEKIVKLEQQDVCDDSLYSPYIQSEKLKQKIVDLYKELCSLTGDEPIKRREVRLQVAKDHPPAPVQKLEQFLNENIGSNGEPPFPDFHDVMMCVAEANATESLGWNAVQVMSEANALFTQCGRALQKRRQQREWRDLLCRVRSEDLRDPADDDPELLARLEENRRTAAKKERDLMERFTNIDCDVPGLNLHVDINDSHDQIVDKSDEQDSDSEKEEKIPIFTNKEVKIEKDIETDKLDSSDIETKKLDSSNSDNNEVTADVKVKIEPVDLSVLYECVENSVTSVIFDVEDPFLVIEISSDSDDD
ncbi:daxx [Bombyx mori]|uniref:Daxx n=1 Tax=Bombyx mori TaxID=7091 RepID=E9JEH3_BOMMO|nr:daxx [Bombyx mori]ADM32516.1 daxx [Bombyx mori]